MHPHFLIFAILSVRALAGLILTAHDHTDWKCKNKAIGNQVDLSNASCFVYQPEQPDAYIHVDWTTDLLEDAFDVSIFSDLNCQDNIGLIWSSLNQTYGNPLNSPTCTGMSLIADGPWGSAMRSNFTTS